MADIELTLGGDASGATAALTSTSVAALELGGATKSLEGDWKKLEEQGKRQEAQLDKLKAGFLAASAVAVKFGIDSVKAYAEAERVSRQLERAAGDLAGAFEQQADALEATLNVDGELIKQQQTLLLQWGAAPSAIEPTIRAIQDYAVATGKDALTATMELIKGVETGGARFKALGITYEDTGDRTKDLTSLTNALAAKFGGAAEADAHTLGGSVRGAEIAMDNLKEAFGGVMAAMESKLGVLSKVTGFLSSIARQVSGASSLADVAVALGPAGLALAAAQTYAGSQPEAPDITRGLSTPVMAAPFSILKPQKKAAGGGKSSRAAAAKEEADDVTSNLWRVVDEQEKADAALEKLSLDKLAFDRKIAKEQDDAELKHADEQAKAMEAAEKDLADRTAKKVKDAQAAGDAIGAAMVNALADQLSKLAEGGEFDAALFVGDILAAAVGVAGGIIGTAFGAPAVGAAIGNLAAMGIRAGASGISRANKKAGARSNTYHDGGWVGAPRYHDGSWIAPDEQRAVLQSGERVLSRQEVRNAGGPGAVDGMARGGRAVTLNITAIDTKSIADTFSGAGGNGLKQALRRGQGALPGLFGKGPR